MKRVLLVAVAMVWVLSAAAQTRAECILREIRNPKSKYVVVVAHRGDWRNFPENSLEAIESAIRMGVDVVEVDVHRTADGHLVVCHDKTINRTTSGRGKIAELTLDSIRRCSLRAGHGVRLPKYKMPTLEEVLDLCRDRVLINIDKGYGYYDQILAMLVERGMVDQVIIKSSKQPSAIESRFASHEHNMHHMPIINYTAKQWERHEPLFEAWLASGVPTPAYEVCWDGSLSGEERIFRRVVKSGAKLWINTLWDSLCGGAEHGLEDDRAIGHEEQIYGKVLSLGCSIIQTDRPAMLLEYLTRKGRHTLE